MKNINLVLPDVVLKTKGGAIDQMKQLQGYQASDLWGKEDLISSDYFWEVLAGEYF